MGEPATAVLKSLVLGLAIASPVVAYAYVKNPCHFVSTRLERVNLGRGDFVTHVPCDSPPLPEIFKGGWN